MAERARRGPRVPPGSPLPGAPAHTLEIVIPSAARYLSLVRRVAEWIAMECGFEGTDRMKIVLAVEEATANIIRHSCGGDSHQRIRLLLTPRADGLEIEFIDTGPGTASPHASRKAAARLTPGGLGVPMIKRCVDEYHYELLPEGGARLLLWKCRQGGKGAPRPKAGAQRAGRTARTTPPVRSGARGSRRRRRR